VSSTIPTAVERVEPPRVALRAFATDVEGLRAVAVVGVVAFHAHVPGFLGGYTGVDVFFVISGYLITSLLLGESIRSGRIDFAAFYARRARRILPAASVVLVAVALASVALLSPLGAYRALGDILASTFYLANWHFIREGTDYLGAATAESPVLHFWSLAVEEQFYIVWPVLVLAIVTLSRRLAVNGSRVVFLLLAIVTTSSFAYSLVATNQDPVAAYMATTTRAWEFGVGGLIAACSAWLGRARGVGNGLHRLAWPLGWAGLAALVAGSLTLDGQTPYPGTAALLPVLGTAAIIVAGLVGGTGRASVGALLSLPPVRFLGRVSFSWYLWHWPLLIFAEVVWGELAWEILGLLGIGALVLAIGTYFAVEAPLMASKTLRRRTSSAIALGLLCTVVAASTTLGSGTAVLAVAAQTGAAQAIEDAAGFGPDTGANSGPTTPSPLEAPDDRPRPEICELDYEVTAPEECVIGSVTGTPVVIFGDSHASQWIPALTEIAHARDWQMVILAKNGCPVPDIAPRDDGERYSRADCAEWRDRTLDLIVTDIRPELVFVSSLSTYPGSSAEVLDAWDRSLDRLRQADAPIVYLRDTPFPGRDIPLCVSGASDNWAECAFDFEGARGAEPILAAAATGSQLGVTVIDFTGLLCDDGRCPAVRNGILLYRDDSHLTATAARLLAPALDDALVGAELVEARG
jgi:peptidoglycan/LPS O-acetylase OafA/YrhL